MTAARENLIGRLPQLGETHVYHQGWYPLAMSGEVKEGALLGRDFLGGRVIVYRDASGKPVVQSAYCPHLGADLCVGDLVEGQVRCAFHHWTFDKTGICTRLPTEDKIPPKARIFTYASAEAWGLVWAFSGATPLFDLPTIPEAEEPGLIYRTHASGIVPYDPWLPTSNGIDFQHLRALHGLSISQPDEIQVKDYSIEYTLTEHKKRRHGLITGTNSFSLYRNDDGHETFVLFSGTPVRPGATLAYYVVGVRDTNPQTESERHRIDQRLDAITALTVRLLEEDEKVLSTMRFRQGVLVPADRYLARYFKYVREFPTASFLEAC